MTVSSFTGVSLHPPQILICVNQRANTHTAIVASGYFAVNLLGAHQEEWGMRFAGLQPVDGDRFKGIGCIRRRPAHRSCRGCWAGSIAACSMRLALATIPSS